MPVPTLLSLKDVASQLGMPQAALERAATEAGLIIQCGSRKKIREDEIEELIETCRVRPKGPASTNANEKAARASGSSVTKAAPRSLPAQKAAQRLKHALPSTSRQSTAQVVQLTPKT